MNETFKNLHDMRQEYERQLAAKDARIAELEAALRQAKDLHYFTEHWDGNREDRNWKADIFDAIDDALEGTQSAKSE